MDRRTKKRLQTLNKKLQTLRQQLAGARRQVDDPADVEKLAGEVSAAEAEMKRLKEA